jgi:hypothetical protein
MDDGVGEEQLWLFFFREYGGACIRLDRNFLRIWCKSSTLNVSVSRNLPSGPGKSKFTLLRMQVNPEQELLVYFVP